MRKLARIFAAFAAIGMLATVGVVGFNLYRASQKPAWQANIACKPRKQLMTPFYTDWLVSHIPSAAQSCADGDMQVVLNNGEIGNRHYREDKTLESETIWTEALKERRHIVYAADGKRIERRITAAWNGRYVEKVEDFASPARPRFLLTHNDTYYTG